MDLRYFSGRPGRIDLHMHTTASDGTDTPEEIIEKVKKAGIGLFSVTDHDAIKGCGIIRGLRRPGDPRFITGVEFSCREKRRRPDREGKEGIRGIEGKEGKEDKEGLEETEEKYHILGYGFDPDSEPIRRVVDLGHSYRMQKLEARLVFLQEEFGFVFPKEEKDRLFSMDNPGKPHIGNLMVQYGYARSKDEGIREYLNRHHYRGKYVKPEEAIEGILGSGGIPVLAHPAFGDGDQNIRGEELERRIRKLKGFGLQGLEAYYSRFTPEIREELLALAERYDLYITAGSDYHGANKTVNLGETGLDGRAGTQALPGRMRAFLEAVREVAAK